MFLLAKDRTLSGQQSPEVIVLEQIAQRAASLRQDAALRDRLELMRDALAAVSRGEGGNVSASVGRLLDALALGRLTGSMTADGLLAEVRALGELRRRDMVRFLSGSLEVMASGGVRDPAEFARQVLGSLAKARQRSRGEEGGVAAAPLPVTGTIAADASGSIFDAARRAASAVRLDADALAFLRARSTWTGSDAQWTAAVHEAAALDRLTDNLGYRGTLELLGANVVEAAFSAVKPGTVFLMFHCGYIRAAKNIYANLKVDGREPGLVITPRGGELRAREDPKQALFASLRAVQSGRNLWIAPDGPFGAQAAPIHVLGVESAAAAGAALIVHASRAPTVFYRIERRGDTMFPVIEHGPMYEAGERYEAFAGRFMRVYARKLEELLTGDPGNLVVRPRWARLFAEAWRAKTHQSA